MPDLQANSLEYHTRTRQAKHEVQKPMMNVVHFERSVTVSRVTRDIRNPEDRKHLTEPFNRKARLMSVVRVTIIDCVACTGLGLPQMLAHVTSRGCHALKHLMLYSGHVPTIPVYKTASTGQQSYSDYILCLDVASTPNTVA